MHWAALSRVLKNSRGCRAWVLRGRGKERGGRRYVMYRGRRETRHMPRNPHAPGGLRAAWGHLRRCHSSTICSISPASRRLASAPAAPVTAPLGVFQHPVKGRGRFAPSARRCRAGRDHGVTVGREGSISARRDSSQSGSFNDLPSSSIGSSTANPGPSVAISNSTPLGSRKYTERK